MSRVNRFDAAFLAASALVALLVTWLNWDTTTWASGIPLYEEQKQTILAGFDASRCVIGSPTCPSWGYAWFFILAPTKALQIGFQEVLGVLAAWVLLRHLVRIGIPRAALALVAILLVASVPFYALQANRWPYAMAATLVVFALCFTHRGVLGDPTSRWFTALGGVAFGALLNFRSDLVLAPIGLSAALWFARRRERGAHRLPLLWIAVTYLCLVPWMAFTKHVTGHVLLTSTNGGAHIFEGLGCLPDNAWGVTPSDFDPRMHQILRDGLGAGYEPRKFITYEGDRILKPAVVRLIAEKPMEFARKCARNVVTIWTSGTYPGDFDLPWSRTLAVTLVWYSLLLLPFTTVIAARSASSRSSSFFLLVSLLLLYQMTLNTIGYFSNFYTSMVYMVHVANIAGAIAWIAGPRARDGERRDGLVALGFVLAIFAPRVVWAACLSLPNLRLANYSGLLATCALAAGLAALARTRRQAIAWVLLAALQNARIPFWRMPGGTDIVLAIVAGTVAIASLWRRYESVPGGAEASPPAA